MAASYWNSSQRKYWRLTRERLEELRTSVEKTDALSVSKAAALSLPDHRHLGIFFHGLIQRLGRRMSVRQQALATAELFLRRFYLRVPIRETNAYLTLATCVYLACKIEECPQHIRTVVSEARSLWPEYVTSDTTKLAECEFHLISELDCYLIVHHPYRTLFDIGPEIGISPEETSISWSAINDSYMTDLHLLYPPHLIALTAVFLAVVLKPSGPAGNSSIQATVVGALGGGSSSAASISLIGTEVSGAAVGTVGAEGSGSPQNRAGKLIDWLVESGVDIEELIGATQEMIALYEVWEVYNEKTCKEQLARVIKAKSLTV